MEAQLTFKHDNSYGKHFFESLYHGWKQNKTLTKATEIIAIVKRCH